MFVMRKIMYKSMYISHNYILNAYYLQAQQLHYNNCDVVILMHKRNDKRRCWHSYGTPGAGVDFLNAHNEVSELWEEYIYNYKGNKFIFLWLYNLYLEDFKQLLNCIGIHFTIKNYKYVHGTTTCICMYI